MASARLLLADLAVGTPAAAEQQKNRQQSLHSQRLVTPVCADIGFVPGLRNAASTFQVQPPPKASSSSSISLAREESETENRLWTMQREAAERLASGDLQGALRSSTECAKFSTSCFGYADRARSIHSYILLAEAYVANGLFDRAEALFEHVLVLVGRLSPRSRLLTSRSPSLVRLAILSLINLAYIKQKRGLPHEALVLYERALVSVLLVSPSPILHVPTPKLTLPLPVTSTCVSC